MSAALRLEQRLGRGWIVVASHLEGKSAMTRNPFVAALEAHRRRGHIPGIAAAVVDAERVRAIAAVGNADLATHAVATPETIWHWFSMTKIVTVTAALRLVDEGKLDLDAPVCDCLPGILPESFSSVRVRHLANHSAGLANPFPIRWVRPAGAPAPDQREFVARLVARYRKPRFTPGTRAAYSNLGALLLGEVIAETAGEAFVDYVTRAVLDPLGMYDTRFTYDTSMLAVAATGYQRTPPGARALLTRFLPQGVVGQREGRFVAFRPFELDGAAYGGLVGPVDDATRLVRCYLNDGELDGNRIISPTSAIAARTITLAGKPFDLGLGWFRRHKDTSRGRTHVEHLGGGGGFSNVMRLEPRLGIGTVIMSNTTHRLDVNRIADELNSIALRTGCARNA